MSGHLLGVRHGDGQAHARCSCGQWAAGGAPVARLLALHDAHLADVDRKAGSGQGALFPSSSQAGLQAWTPHAAHPSVADRAEDG